jgi:hypothetical protein
MASDEIPDNEQPEIIPKPPSHPITTALLISSFAGTILCIGFVWAELFGSYLLGAKTPVEPGMENHTWKEHKENREGMIDHYSQDYKLDGKPEKSLQDTIYTVKQDLHLLEKQQEAPAGP